MDHLVDTFGMNLQELVSIITFIFRSISFPFYKLFLKGPKYFVSMEA